jgi:phosphoglycerate dehydrogenase-like enzyme
MTRPFVLQTEDLDHAAAAWISEACDFASCHFSEGAKFDALLARADAIVVRTYTRVDASFLDRAPTLKVVGRAGVGLDRIDVGECRRRGIEVVHTPDANTQAVAEYVFAMLFDALRPRLFLDKPITQDRWNKLRRELEAPNQLCELTLGVLGLGRVGKRVARIAQGLGMDVIYHDLLKIPEDDRQGAKPVPLERLLAKADILSIHIDSRSGNRHFVNSPLLAQMQPTAIIVNTSRGLVVDARALAAFLELNPQATALIDVHDPEPFEASYPLLGLANAHLSPHLAASTATAHVNMSWVVKDVLAVLQGRKPEFAAPAAPPAPTPAPARHIEPKRRR